MRSWFFSQYDTTANKLWVVFSTPDGNMSGVVSVDGTTNSVSAPIDESTGSLIGLAVPPAQKKAYTLGGGGLVVIDTSAGMVAATVPLPPLAWWTSPSTARPTRCFVLGTTGIQSALIAVDAATNTPSMPTYFASNIQTQDFVMTFASTRVNIGGIAVDSTTGKLYVVGYEASGQTHVLQFDEATMTMIADVPIGTNMHALPTHPSVLPGNGVTLLANDGTSNVLHIVDGDTVVTPPQGFTPIFAEPAFGGDPEINVVGIQQVDGGSPRIKLLRYFAKSMMWSPSAPRT
jgi:hypothetical protein